MSFTIHNQHFRITTLSGEKGLLYLTERKGKDGVWTPYLRTDHRESYEYFETAQEARNAIRTHLSFIKHINGGFL